MAQKQHLKGDLKAEREFIYHKGQLVAIINSLALNSKIYELVFVTQRPVCKKATSNIKIFD